MLRLLLVASGSGEGEREGCAKFGQGEERRGEEREGKRWFVWVGSALQQRESERSSLE